VLGEKTYKYEMANEVSTTKKLREAFWTREKIGIKTAKLKEERNIRD